MDKLKELFNSEKLAKLKELVKKIRIVDFIIVGCVILALLVGFVTFKGVRQTADKQIEATSNIVFKVYMRGVTFSGKEIPIKKGDKAFIVLPTLNSKTVVIVVEDVGQPDLYDVVVTLTDKAKITKDGAVVGGNKVKMGLPITLEGAEYRFTGSVSDIKIVDAVEEVALDKDINTTDDVQ